MVRFQRIKQKIPALSSFLLLAETWKGKKRWKSWLGYFSIHDGNMERKEKMENLLGCLPCSAHGPAWPSLASLVSPGRPRGFPHFFSFHVSTLSPAQATSHISFLSAFPPSAQAIFHISFLSFPSFRGGGGGGSTDGPRGNVERKERLENVLGCLWVHGGNAERKERLENGLGCT